MTKYECRCAANSPCRCVIECSPGIAPFRCCLTGNHSCNWRRVEDQEVEASARIIPEWCRTGAWVWFKGDKDTGYDPGYFKIERTVGELAYGKSYNNGFPVHYTYLKPARLRPWTYKEAIGKIVFWKGDYDYQENAAMLVGADTDGDFSLYTVGPVTAEELTKEIYYQSDGSPCGVLEHYENGEWVE